MATLDNVIQMQQSGMTDTQISTNLMNQGVSPNEINDAINQARVKGALSTPQPTLATGSPQASTTPTNLMSEFPQTTQAQSPYISPQVPTLATGATPNITPPATNPAFQGMSQSNNPNSPNAFQQAQAQQGGQSIGTQTPTQESTISQGFTQSPPQQQPPAQSSIMDNQGTPGANAYPQEQVYPQDQYAQEEAYPQENYDQGYYQDDGYGADPYAQGGYSDSETITEIAEQVVNAKFREFKKKTGDLVSFQHTAHEKMTNIEHRLKRLESTIDKLQEAIIGKIGEFGENTNMIKRDLEALHNTTSKLMNPLIDNFRELEKANKKK